jgi:hypothetical protein
MAARFFHTLGASLLDRTICSSAGGDALVATYGGKIGMHLEDYAQAQLILIWGSNSDRQQPALLDLCPAGQAPAPSSSASTRAAPRRPTSATSTWPCCPAPTARWPWA